MMMNIKISLLQYHVFTLNLLHILNLPYLTFGVGRLSLGPTVFHGPWHFEPSHGICPLPRNFNSSTEFRWIWEM